MPTCDTTWLLALVDPHDPRHDEARRTAETATLTVPQPVLTELLQVVYHRRRRMDGEAGAHQAARRILEALEALPTIHITQAPLDASRAYHEHPSFSYVDALVVTAARNDSEGILTFDPRQEAAVTPPR